MARFALAVIATVAFSGIAAGISASPAAAESSSAITSQYPWPHNGCTRVTDYPSPGVSFTYACNHHDGCYAGHWASRDVCDYWFYNDMVNACYLGPWYQRGTCLVVAGAYWSAVRLLGQRYYDSNGSLSRISTPMTTA